MIELSIDGDVAHITLNRPEKMNALDADAVAALGHAFAEAETAQVRALVLSGRGRAFCAGRDISGVDPETDDVEAYLGGLVAPLLARMRAFPAPTFAAAQGAALGVGLGLLVATDVVYLGESARIGSPFGAIGAVLDSGGHALFLERLGAHRTLDLIYTGQLLSGREAVDAGLFARAYPDDELLSATLDAARRVATGPTAAFVQSKRLLQRIADERLGLLDVIEAETRAQRTVQGTDDYRAGFRAFQTKQKPAFLGR